MQILNSSFKQLSNVSLPFLNRQLRYHDFDVDDPKMPCGFEDYAEIVSGLVSEAGLKHGIVNVTVDEKIVIAGMSQRRPRPHVDGCFVRSLNAWRNDPIPIEPSWLHDCNKIEGVRLGRMAVIVAASVAGCRAWDGMFRGDPKNDGDLSHISDQLGDGVTLPANVGFLLSPDCIHESMVFSNDVKRSFLRIALPLDFCY